MITIEKTKLENSLTLYETKKESLLKQISEINDVFQKKTIKNIRRDNRFENQN